MKELKHKPRLVLATIITIVINNNNNANDDYRKLLTVIILFINIQQSVDIITKHHYDDKTIHRRHNAE